MIGTYYQPYCHGAARIPMPGIRMVDRKIGIADDLSLWELLTLGEIREAIQRCYQIFVRVILPRAAMIVSAVALLWMMLFISLRLHAIFKPEAKPEPIIIYPKVLVEEKKEVKPEPKQVKIVNKQKQDVTIKRKPVKTPSPNIAPKRIVRTTKTVMAEKSPTPEITRSTIASNDMNADNPRTIDIPAPVRSTDFRPAQPVSSASIERGPRPDVELGASKSDEGVYINDAYARSKREGIGVQGDYSNAGPRNELTMRVQGTVEDPGIHIEGVPLASLEACPNSLDEIEHKKEILKIIGTRKRCRNYSGEYVFYKTNTLTSFRMTVKPAGGRRLKNRCDELHNAYQCITSSRE